MVLQPGEKVDSERVVEQCGSQVAAVLHFAYEIVKLTQNETAIPPGFRGVWQEYCDYVEKMQTPKAKRYLQLHNGHCTFLMPEERRFVNEETIRASHHGRHAGGADRPDPRRSRRPGSTRSACCRRWRRRARCSRSSPSRSFAATEPEEAHGLAWYHTPLGIALLALFVLGPLALPLVWRSPALGPRGRVVATVLILLYTALLCWQVWLAVQLALGQLQP